LEPETGSKSAAGQIGRAHASGTWLARTPDLAARAFTTERKTAASADLSSSQRHFVASNTSRYLLSLIMSVDIITMYYCGVRSCPRASLPPSRSPARPSYEVSRAKFRRQDAKQENPRLMQRMEDSSLRLIYDCRFTIVDLRSLPHCGGSPTRWSRRADLKVGATSASGTGR
jgi:hypothetical protein